MADSQKKQLSLDTNLLLDLAKPQDFAHDFRETFQQHGYALRLAPTVLLELEHLICFGVEPHRALAIKATDKIAEWQLTPFDLPSVSHAIAERFVHRLLQQRLIPDDEFNVGFGPTRSKRLEIAVNCDFKRRGRWPQRWLGGHFRGKPSHAPCGARAQKQN